MSACAVAVMKGAPNKSSSQQSYEDRVREPLFFPGIADCNFSASGPAVKSSKKWIPGLERKEIKAKQLHPLELWAYGILT